MTISYQTQAVLEVLKRFAKQLKRAHGAQKLAACQDRVAKMFGYQNWSMLHKHLAKMSQTEIDELLHRIRAVPDLGALVEKDKTLTLDVAGAKAEMEEWVRSTFTPLIDFAFYDSESENGFAWPDVYLSEELQDEFAGRYPADLIEEVATQLEVDDGPWGREDDGQ
jgi:hypothetical protein